MKYLLVALLVGTSLLGQASTHGQKPTQNSPIDQLVKALSQGDATTVAKFLPNSVALTVLQKTPSYYSRKQAEQVLADFFGKNTPRKFEITHEGGKNASQFTIGQLHTSSGVYRVSFYLQEMGGQSVVQNLSIERKDN